MQAYVRAQSMARVHVRMCVRDNYASSNCMRVAVDATGGLGSHGAARKFSISNSNGPIMGCVQQQTCVVQCRWWLARHCVGAGILPKLRCSTWEAQTCECVHVCACVSCLLRFALLLPGPVSASNWSSIIALRVWLWPRGIPTA